MTRLETIGELDPSTNEFACAFLRSSCPSCRQISKIIRCKIATVSQALNHRLLLSKQKGLSKPSSLSKPSCPACCRVNSSRFQGEESRKSSLLYGRVKVLDGITLEQTDWLNLKLSSNLVVIPPSQTGRPSRGRTDGEQGRMLSKSAAATHEIHHQYRSS